MGQAIDPGSTPTAIELETLEAVVRYGSQEVAAARLGVSPRTVKARLYGMRRRLRARTTAQAYRIALKRGLIPPP
jgi:DNA-binding CsgD family transcriptional regulator